MNGNADSGSMEASKRQDGTSSSMNGSQSNARMGRMTQRRTAYDFLKDGTYSADRKGEVNGSWDPYAKDFTQGARDLVKDAGDAVGDMGREIGGTVKNAGRGIGQSVRGMMSH
jgi:hypothetical protein